MDTIFALATARGKAGVAVIRISGPQAVAAAERLAGKLPAAGAACGASAMRPANVLDEALVLVFADRRSFTGEDVVELQLHGSTAVVAGSPAAPSRLMAAACGRRSRASSPAGRWKTAGWTWRRSRAWPT